LVNALNENPDIANAPEQDPTQLDRIQQNLDLADQSPREPSGITDLSNVLDPSLAERPPREPPPPDQDLDDLPQ
jgi:hypothetical protein